MFTLIVAWEASCQIAERTTGVWAQLPWGVVPALVIAWLGRQQLRPRWPLAAREHAYRIYAAMPLVIAMSLWMVLINLSSTGDSTWLPYLPLLNPLDISVALCFASLAMWWSSLSERQRAPWWQFDMRALIAIVAAMVFIWLNAALIRTLHHNFGAPITAYGMSHSTLVQASLSIFWGVLGFAAMTHRRAPALALCVDRRRGVDDRRGRETVPGRSVQCRHDRAHHFLPHGGRAVAGDGLSRAIAAAKGDRAGNGSDELKQLDSEVDTSPCAVGLRGLLLATVSAAAPPSKNDYASGMTVEPPYTQPMIETVLPDEVYRTVTREDLGDLRVFNADGMPVPHAFCAAPESTTPQVTEQSLQVFVLRGRDQVLPDSTRVDVETAAGTRVDVQESAAVLRLKS